MLSIIVIDNFTLNGFTYKPYKFGSIERARTIKKNVLEQRGNYSSIVSDIIKSGIISGCELQDMVSKADIWYLQIKLFKWHFIF